MAGWGLYHAGPGDQSQFNRNEMEKEEERSHTQHSWIGLAHRQSVHILNIVILLIILFHRLGQPNVFHLKHDFGIAIFTSGTL